jgi:hypothetical protein
VPVNKAHFDPISVGFGIGGVTLQQLCTIASLLHPYFNSIDTSDTNMSPKRH